jgi:acyl transferase domain-containing protein
MMDSILEPYIEKIKKVNLKPPQIPYISNVTGIWITEEEATSPDYWARHLRQTVCFAQGLQQVLKEPNLILLEVGPNKTLNTLVNWHPDKAAGQIVLTSLGHFNNGDTDVASMLNTLGQLWLADVKVDWSGFYAHERHHRIPLPSYPFERQRYWIEPEKQADVNTHQVKLCKKSNIADWFYVPSWKRTKLPIFYQSGDILRGEGKWLLFVKNDPFGTAITDILKQEGLSIIRVLFGDSFEILNSSTYQINPKDAKQYQEVIDRLTANQGSIDAVIHLWNYSPAKSSSLDNEQAQLQGFYSLLFLTQALGNVNQKLPIWVVTSNAQPLKDTITSLAVEKSTLLGFCKVIPQEYPNLICRTLDFSYGDTEDANRTTQHLEQLMSEIADASADSEVAYRDRDRWVPILEPIKEVPVNQNNRSLLNRGVYLITGGLGQMGLAIAEYLAQHFQAKLVLISRSVLPSEDTWSDWVTKHDETDAISQKILKVQKMRKLGAEVILRPVDVANISQMRKLLQEVHGYFGNLNGVIHAAGFNHRHIRFISDTLPEMVDEMLRAKIQGTLVLQEILKDEPIDFCILCSSISTVLGGLKLGAYAASNRFLDSFIQSISDTDRQVWLSLNWDTWTFPNFEYQICSGFSDMNIKVEEGLEVLARTLLLPHNQIVISTVSLPERIEYVNSCFQSINPVVLSPSLPHEDSLNKLRYSRSKIEKIIYSNLQEISNIDFNTLDTYENKDFFFWNLDSMMILNMIANLEQSLGLKIPISQAFNALTVSEMADLLCRLIEEKKCFSLTKIESIEESCYCYELEIDGEIATVIINEHDYLEYGLPERAKNFRPYIK